MPAATRTDYEDYVRGVSGLLTFAGFDGTFADPATHTEPIGADDGELAVLLHALRRRFGVQAFGVADIVESLEAGQFLDANCLPLELAERWDKRHGGKTSSFGKALGVWLSRLDGRYADALKIVKRGKDRNKVSRFAIVGRETVTGQQPVAEPTPETVPPAPDYSEAWQTEDDDREDVIAQLEFSPASVTTVVCTLHERHPDLVHIKRCGVVGCPGE